MYNTLGAKRFFQGFFFPKTIFAVFSFLYLILNYKYLLDYPTGLHFIRQTDSISFILYYFHQDTFNFFDVGNLSLAFKDGRASCEFPILYYFFYLLFKCIGVHFELIRWSSLILSATSIYFLLNAAFYVLRNMYLSIICVLLVISSSVYRYYSVNFLPDSFALSFVFIGLYHLIRFDMQSKRASFYLMFFFFTIASLLKIYYGIYLAGVVAVFFLVNREIFRRSIAIASVCVILILAWYVFSIFYNTRNHTEYYLTHALPIWQMTKAEVLKTFTVIWEYWYPKYYLPTMFHLFLIIAIIIILRIKKVSGLSYFNQKLLLICFVGFLLYGLIFFRQFRDHDYYFLPILPLLFILTVDGTSKLLDLHWKRYFSIPAFLIMGVIAILGYDYTTTNMERRFSNASFDKHSIVAARLYGVGNYLDKEKINLNARFIVVGDRTPNGSLVFLNRFGWTYPDFKLDPGSVMSNLPLADYLLVLEPSANRIPEEIMANLEKCPKMIYNSNHIYDLKNYHRSTN